MARILESQPDLVFCINLDGQIKYISEHTKTYIRMNESTNPSHMNQILNTESMNVLTECLRDVKTCNNSTHSNNCSGRNVTELKVIYIISSICNCNDLIA